MKQILAIIGFIVCFGVSYSQPFTNRGSAAITNVDQRLKAGLNFYLPWATDTTLNSGLDSLGALLLVIKTGDTSLYMRIPRPGGNKWAKMLRSGDPAGGVISFNTRTGAVTLNTGDITTALGYTPPNPNGTNLQYMAGDGSKITFPTIPAQFNPIQGYGITITGTYPNKTFTADTTVLFPALRATISGGGGSGIASLNGLTAATQTFATGTTGTDFNISSVSTTHTFNLPIVNGTNTGKVTPTLFNTWNAKISNITGLVTAGSNVTITGSGTSGSPYVVNSSGGGGTDSARNAGFGLSKAVAGTLVTFSFDSTAGGTGNGFHTRNYNDVRYQPLGSYITGLIGDVAATGPGNVSATIQANAVTTSKINNNAVTYGKIQAATQQSLLGATGVGNFQEITLGTNLSMTGSVLNASGSGGGVTLPNLAYPGNKSGSSGVPLDTFYYRVFNVLDFGAKNDSSADCRTAILAAIAAMPAAGGSLYFPAGKYLISDSIVITKTMRIYGDGESLGSIQFGAAEGGSTIYGGSGNKNIFVVDSSATGKPVVGFQYLTIRYNGTGGFPTDGSGIVIRGFVQRPYVDHCTIIDFYDDIDIQSAFYWTVSNCYIGRSVNSAMKINDAGRIDTGDWGIYNCQFISKNVDNTSKGIVWNSGGGVRISNCKFDAQTFTQTTQFTYCIYLTNVYGATSDVQIDHVSIEDYQITGIFDSAQFRLGHQIFTNIQIAGVGSSGPAIDVYGAALFVMGSFVLNDWGGNPSPAMRFTNCRGVSVDNGFVSLYASGYQSVNSEINRMQFTYTPGSADNPLDLAMTNIFQDIHAGQSNVLQLNNTANGNFDGPELTRGNDEGTGHGFGINENLYSSTTSSPYANYLFTRNFTSTGGLAWGTAAGEAFRMNHDRQILINGTTPVSTYKFQMLGGDSIYASNTIRANGVSGYTGALGSLLGPFDWVYKHYVDSAVSNITSPAAGIEGSVQFRGVNGNLEYDGPFLYDSTNHKFHMESASNGLEWSIYEHNVGSANFAGTSFRLFNDRGIGASNGGSLEYYSSGTDAPYANSLLIRNYQPGGIVLFDSLQEVARTSSSHGWLVGTSTDAPSSILTATSTTKGFLPPRLNTTQQNAISSPATGLVIYNTDSLGLVDYNGSAWLKERSAGGGSGNTNSNVGSAYRFAIPGTNNIKTLSVGYGLLADSATTNQNNLKVDSATIYTYVRGLLTNSDSLKVLNIGTPGANLLYTNADTLKAKAIGNATTLSDSTIQVNTLEKADQTITANRSVLGASHSLSLGTSGSKLTSLFGLVSGGFSFISDGGAGSTIDQGATGGLNIGNASNTVSLKGGLNLATILVATDANVSTVIGYTTIILPVITANRTFQLNTLTAGNIFIIMNRNTAAFTWSPTGFTIKDGAGNTLSSLVNGKTYIMLYDGTDFISLLSN